LDADGLRQAILRPAEDVEVFVETALFDKTLAHLADQRLLTLSGDPGSPERTVDIAHEALIDGWPTLRRWLGERSEAEQRRRQFETNLGYG
jgi:hypothetical protein